MGAAPILDFPSHHINEEDAPTYDASPQGRTHLTMVHDDVLDTIGERLGAAALAVYVALERRANRAGICDPSYDTIALAVKLSRRHVIEQVKALKAAGFVKTEQRRNSAQGHLSNVFLLPRHPNLIPLTPSEYSALPPSEVPVNNAQTLVHGVHPPSEDPSEEGGEYSAPPSAQPALPSEDPSEDPSEQGAPKVNTSSTEVDNEKEGPAAPDACASRPKTTSMPFLLLEAMLDEQGVAVGDLSPTEKSKQIGVTKRLADNGMTETDIRHIVRWLSGWKSGVDALSVEQKLTEWRLAGKPSEPTRPKGQTKPLPYNHPKNAKGFAG